MGTSTAVAYITLDLNGFRSRPFYPDEALATYPENIYTIFSIQVSNGFLFNLLKPLFYFDEDGRVLIDHPSLVGVGPRKPVDP